MSARYNKVDEDPNDILLGYLREFCFDPCGEKEAKPEERGEGDSCPVDDSEKKTKKKRIQRKKRKNRMNKNQLGRI